MQKSVCLIKLYNIILLQNNTYFINITESILVLNLFQAINNKKIVILSTLITFVATSMIISNIPIYNKVFAAEIKIPKVSLMQNGGKIDLTPLLNFKDKILTKFSTPNAEPEDSNTTIYSIDRGSEISFNFEDKPSRVDAFLVDYEAEYNTLYALPKTETGSFIANVPAPGLYNAEIHAMYPDGKYVSYSKLINIVDDKLNLLSLTPEKNNCAGPLSLDKIIAIGNPTSSLLTGFMNSQIFKQLSLGATDEIKINLGDNKDVCGILLGTTNPESSINFFAVQSSTDDKKYDDPIVFANTGFGEAPEIYKYPSSITAEFLKIIPLGGTLEKGFGLTDLKIFGK